MDSELRTAIKRAGMKLGGGLLLLAAVIGVRVVIARPSGVESEIAELEQLEVELARDTPAALVKSSDAGGDSESVVSRLGARVREQLRGGERPSAPDAERLVSCNLSGSLQFMRAADCATRGGRSTDVD